MNIIQIAWLRKQNDDMTQQLVIIASKLDDEKLQTASTDTPNTPPNSRTMNFGDDISLISQISLNDTVSINEDKHENGVGPDVDDEQLAQKGTPDQPSKCSKNHRCHKTYQKKDKWFWLFGRI